MISTAFQNGTTVCSFIIEASYPGKKPFHVGTFTTSRLRTFTETQAAADAAAADCLRQFWEKSMPAAVPPPHTVKVVLGSQVFVPDDYDWKRI
jgi:hypothetical protein